MPLIKKIKLAGEDFARDIGAMSSNVVYDGDEGKTSPLNEKIRSIFTAIENINSFEVAIVNGLPSENIDDHTIYFVPEQEGSSTYNEYMYVNNRWELIGTTTIDLSNYLQKSDISVTQIQATGTDIGSITIDGTTTTFKAPTVDIPEQEQSDWLQTDSTAPSFIQDKPSIWEKDDHSVNINEQTSRNEGLYSVVEGSHTGTITRNVDPEDREAEAQEYQAGIDGNNYAHLEGQDNYLGGDMAHVEGYQNIGYGEASHVEGSYNYNDSDVAHIEGTNNINYSWAGHIEGNANIAYGSDTIHVEGYNNKSNSYGSHTEGNDNVVIDSDGAHVEGYSNELTNGSNYAHVEGDNHTLSGSESAHVEGYQHQLTDATYTHVEGQGNEVNSTSYSHVEGYGNVVYDSYAHVEGHNNESNGQGAHVEGENNYIDGDAMYAHVEGSHSESNGYYSHAEGEYNSAYARAVHVFGRANQYETVNSADQYGTYVEIVGNGIITNGAVTQRSNARTLDWNGNEVLAGKLTLGTGPVNNMDAATKGYVDTAISDSIDIIDDGLADVAQSGDYNDLINRPTQLSDLTNDVGFITSSDIPTTVSSFTNDAEYITASDIPTTVSSFTNDSGYITSDDISITRYISEGDVLAEIAVGNTTTELYVPHPFEFDEFDLDLSSYTIAQLSQGIIYPNSGLIEDITSAFQSNKTKLNVYLKTYINDTSSSEIVATAEGQQFDITMDGSTLSDVMKFTFAGSYVNSESDALVPPILVGSLYIVPVQNMIMLVSTNVGMIKDDIETYISSQEFATQSWVSDNYASQTWVQDQGYITSIDLPTIPTSISELTDDIGIATMSDIPTVPSDLSGFNNDMGYLTSSDISATSNISSGIDIGSIEIDGVTTTFRAPSADASVYALNLSSYTKQQLSGGIQDSADATVISNINANYQEGITKVKFSFIDDSATPDVIATAAGPKFSITLNGNTYNNVMKFTFAGVYLDDASQALAPPAYIGSIYIVPNANLVMLMGSDVVRELDSLEDQVGTLNTNVNDISQIVNNLADVATSGDYNDLSNTPDLSGYITSSDLPEIPTDLSSFNNDVGFITLDDLPTIPTNVSELNNDAGYIADLSVNQILASGTAIGSIDVNGVTTTFYAPSQSGQVYFVDVQNSSNTYSFVNAEDNETSIMAKINAGTTVYLRINNRLYPFVAYDGSFIVFGDSSSLSPNDTTYYNRTFIINNSTITDHLGFLENKVGAFYMMKETSTGYELPTGASFATIKSAVDDGYPVYVGDESDEHLWLSLDAYDTSFLRFSNASMISDNNPYLHTIEIYNDDTVTTNTIRLRTTVSNTLSSGTAIGTITSFGTTTTLYAPSNEPVFIMTEFDADTQTISLPEGNTFASIKALVDAGRNVLVGLDDYDNSCWFSLTEYEPNRLVFSSTPSDYHQEIIVIKSDNTVSNPWKDLRTTISNTLSSGVAIGTITASGTTTTLYAPSASQTYPVYTDLYQGLNAQGVTDAQLLEGAVATNSTLVAAIDGLVSGEGFIRHIKFSYNNCSIVADWTDQNSTTEGQGVLVYSFGGRYRQNRSAAQGGDRYINYAGALEVYTAFNTEYQKKVKLDIQEIPSIDDYNSLLSRISALETWKNNLTDADSTGY